MSVGVRIRVGLGVRVGVGVRVGLGVRVGVGARVRRPRSHRNLYSFASLTSSVACMKTCVTEVL